MEISKQYNLQEARRILRYANGTLSDGLSYKQGEEVKRIGYIESDWAGDVKRRKSTSGFVFLLGISALSWSSKKQQIVALSSTVIEYVAAVRSAAQAILRRKLLEELNVKQTILQLSTNDNKSTIALTKNPVLHRRSKYIDIKFHYARDLVKNKEILQIR